MQLPEMTIDLGIARYRIDGKNISPLPTPLSNSELPMPLVETDRKQDVRRLRSARKQRTVIGDNFPWRFTQLC